MAPDLSGLSLRVAALDSTRLIWPGILIGFAVYLLVLGLFALFQPRSANMFLGGFAQSRLANWTEAILRALVGLAFLGNASVMGGALAAGFGVVMIVSAAGLVIFSDTHRRFARQAVAAIAEWIRWFGLVSFLLGAALLAMLRDQLVDLG